MTHVPKFTKSMPVIAPRTSTAPPNATKIIPPLPLFAKHIKDLYIATQLT